MIIDEKTFLAILHDDYIYETVVWDGAMKVYRIVNLSIRPDMFMYSMYYDTLQEALDGIEDGVERDGKIVKRISPEHIGIGLGIVITNFEKNGQLDVPCPESILKRGKNEKS